MDIRKFLKKTPAKRAAPTPVRTSPRRSRRSEPIEDDEDVQPRRKRTPKVKPNPPEEDPPQPSPRRSRRSEPIKDDEDFQPRRKRTPKAKPNPPEEDPPQPSPRRSRRSEPIKDDEDVQPRRKRTPKAKPNPPEEDPPQPKKRAHTSTDAGFGGGGGSGASEPLKKKPRWVPRSDDPPNRGNKPLPKGAPDCLSRCVFVITGMLDSLLREECTDLCKEYGARVVGSVSKKVTHGIVGTEPGQSKISKLKANRTPMINEDELFEMINKTYKGEVKEEVKAVKEEVKEDMIMAEEKPKKVKTSTSPGKKKGVTKGKAPAPNSAALWVDKYKPANSSELVANPKAVKDLRNWLINWKSKFLYGDGHSWKQRERGEQDWPAAMLVGSPGIGKTTAAHIVCREAGFEPHEFNASDVRNKGGVQMLAETVMVANTMSKYLKVDSDDRDGKGACPEGQVLIMDEVDGMSSGDRGGGQELIRMIKKSKVPVICIANDDSSSNMRSLANNCFKIRFRRPMVTQVTKRLTSIAMREGFRAMQDQTLAKLAEGCHGDIRQMINLLQTWRCSSANLSFADVRSRLEMEGKTVIQKSVFELAKSFFTPGIDGSPNSLIARTDNYFADSDLMPLFIQENYINTSAAGHSLEALADAAECISEGDLMSTTVRSEQRWDLMPATAVMSTIRPGTILAGGLGSQPMFPSYLGNTSKGNKWKRIVTGLEMKVRAVKTSSGSPRNFRLDYIPALTSCLATPLIRSGAAGIAEVTERLDAYFLERDPDWLEILEAGVYAKGRGPLENIKGAVKSSFTREYNAGVHARSSVTGMRIGVKTSDAPVAKKISGGEDVAVVDDDVVPESEESDSEVDVEKEFGVKKGKAKKGKTAAKKASGGARGRGRGGARGGSRGGSRGAGRGSRRGRGRGKRS